MKKLFVIIIALTSAILAGCAGNVSPDTYESGEVGVVSRTHKGTIIAKRVINIDNPSGAGGLAGTVAGAAAGSMIGGNTATNIVGATGGAVAAGIIGHQIDKAVNKRAGYEYIIKLQDDKTIAITQEKSIQLAVGQKVIVIYGAMTRIVPDNT